MKQLTKDNCKEESGQLIPVVNFNKCEAKGPCIDVCPYNVFEMKPITEEDRKELSFVGKFKTMAHGNKKAYVINGSLCHACGLCVTACPEKAITLKRLITPEKD